jgi:hypothetical protein
MATHDATDAQEVRRLFWACSVVLITLCGGNQQANADIDVTEYQTTRSVKTERERKLLRERFEAERQQEMSRQAEEQARERLRVEEEQARLAARPLPVRLTEAKCNKCHTDQNYQRAAHTLPGWWSVVLRMRYFNQAELSWSDKTIIVQHLSETYPADSNAVFIEWSMLMLGLLLTAIAGTWIIRRNRTSPLKET